MPVYKAPVEDYLFVLHDLLGVQNIDDIAGFSDLTSDLIRPVLEGIGQFCEDIWQPLNRSGDEEGCHLENGAVRTPAGFADAYKKYCEAGWNKLASPEKVGGAGLLGRARDTEGRTRPCQRLAQLARPLTNNDMLDFFNGAWCKRGCLGGRIVDTSGLRRAPIPMLSTLGS